MDGFASRPPFAPDKARLLDELRERVRRIEGVGGKDGTAVVPLGLPELDATLPGGGLPLGAVHEVIGPDAVLDSGVATAFSAMLLAKLSAGRGPVLWVARTDDLYVPGLATYGLAPEDLLLVQAVPGRKGETDVLWVLEEALRHPGVGAVLGEVGELDLAASRRLQLAAEAGGVPGVLLRLGPRRVEASAAVTRWRLTPLPTLSLEVARDPLLPDLPRLGAVAWRAELLRCRGGRPGLWELAWLGPGSGPFTGLQGRPALAEAGEPLQRAGEGLGA